jgi:hypothetical protein
MPSADVLSQPVQFLARPQLVIHAKPTADDLEAERILQEALREYYPGATLEVLKWEDEKIDWIIPNSLPALRTLGSLLHGLSAIKAIVRNEQEERASLKAYKARRA